MRMMGDLFGELSGWCVQVDASLLFFFLADLGLLHFRFVDWNYFDV